MPNNLDDIFEKYQKRDSLPETGPEQGGEEEGKSLEYKEVQPKKTEAEELASLRARVKESPPLPPRKGKDLTEEQRKAADAIVQKLIALAKIKGEQVAIEEATHMNQYIQDCLHDQLIEEKSNLPE